jgi:lauroyl/myristoyl acyltransferase
MLNGLQHQLIAQREWLRLITLCGNGDAFMGDSEPTKLSFPKLARHWLVYAAFRCVEFVLWLLPIEVIWYLGRAMGILGYYVSGKYRRLALSNLRIAFGREKDLAWQRAIARKHFASLFGNILCGFKLPMMNPKDVEARVTVEGMEHTHAAMSKNRPILYLVCHLSCWEILTQIPNLFVFDRKPATVYQPLRNPFLNALMIRRQTAITTARAST